ncbi:hypothetical protein DBR37_09040 [Herminiimonas sp. KBW02]|uniref:S-4TM family putative pore-forming effector n=1 Tax=Herminiimonas glaciei TaxID=523788 RepID=A0ABW2I8U0_9BURK|nr:S-4TM family putative pore-forming effector [Herminiimonas sp. KBW02]RQO36444.1 hypothetical protein DBR37_09040 [Herminiimonas sp. KBW02]
MNNIVKKQNSETSIKRLAAQSALYSSAKNFLAAQFVFSVPVAVLIAFVALTLDKELFGLPKTDIAWFVGLSSGMSFLLIELYLNPVMNYKKETAAKIQQYFDSDVLGIPMCNITYGKPLDQEIVEVWAEESFTSGTPKEEFTNWYRVEVDALPMEVARIICQRANCWWDEDLRRRYNKMIRVVGIALFVVILIIVLALDCTITIILGLIVPLILPFVSVASKVIQENLEAITRLASMREAINDVWQRILTNVATNEELIGFANTIQAGIYNNRRNNPLVFDWIHRRSKRKHEDTTSATTASYVAEYRRSRAS